MKILAAQINPTVGDLEGNRKLIVQKIEEGERKGAAVVLFPELALTGYPPEDLLLLPEFIAAVSAQLEQIIPATSGVTAIVGLPRVNPNPEGKGLYNSAAVIQNGELLGYVDKILLPTYDVFDERRYFEPGGVSPVWEIGGKKVAITICEDLWEHSGLLQKSHYKHDPVEALKDKDVDFVLNLSASPYHFAKLQSRIAVCQAAAKTLNCPVVLCNQVGANDSLIFDGYSLCVDANGLQACAKGFEEDDFIVDLIHSKKEIPIHLDIEDLYKALVLGIKDYFQKQGFRKACLGLSGGIDSALVACLAAAALGSKNVLGLIMPSRYSSDESERDARALARNLGIEVRKISVEAPFNSYLDLLSPEFEGKPVDATEENLQARIRGMILMAFSNKFGTIILSTGNKSELAMGYSTLYGDMCGGLAVISDVTKQQVYALAKWINREKEVIPVNTLQRAPSAELRPNQKDSDSLPDYEVVDNVLQAYVEECLDPSQIAKQFGYPLELVEDLVRRIHLNEYKRRQAPPGLRVSEKAFSVGRKFPIVQRWVK